MKLLYVGDIMGDPGIEVVEKVIPGLKRQEKIDLVIAQSENVSEGKGITSVDFKRLQRAGIDFFTGGNWSLFRRDILPALGDPAQPIIRPANYPAGTPGLGYKYTEGPYGKVLVVSLLGKIVGKDADRPVDNPLQVIDGILEAEKAVEKAAIVVNLHGDFSSEKVIIGHYLDGRATLVAGDHWHVPTADARVLPGGTAHITDVGMCGVLDASLGISFKSVVPRWRDNRQTRNVLETGGPRQFNALLVETGGNGLAKTAELIQKQW
jgi:metallophosphoesterase (TIGR00282 family)